ncbi:hypothetical protein OG203_18135 [Nocardia sp. NBC_01499]|uniref:hypothetical protein n=1 Tax=Nocardia sp. NBC_01499 TaxID=2903597 RepID=UPI00386E2A31
MLVPVEVFEELTAERVRVLEAGWLIDWSGLDADENAHASMAALRGDTRPTSALFQSLVRPA